MRRAIQEDQPQQLCGVAHLPSALKRAKLTRRRIQISNLGKTGDNGRPPAVLERCCLHLPLESHPLEPVQSLRFAPMGQSPRLTLLHPIALAARALDVEFCRSWAY